MLALVGLAAGLGFAFLPIRGRTGDEWLPVVVPWSWAALLGGRRQLAPGPNRGHVATVDPSRPRPGSGSGSEPGSGSVDIQHMDARFRSGGPRTVFDGLKVVGTPFGSQPSAPELGMVIDPKARTATAALVVRGHSFALLGSSDQDGRIAAWARVLSSMAREGSAIHRIQWIESCLPDNGGAVRRHFDDHAVLGADSPAASSYRALMDEAAPVTRRHRVLVTLTIRTGRSSVAARSSRSESPPPSMRSSAGGSAGIGGVLAREVLSLHRALDGADVSVEGVLSPGALAREIVGASTSLVDTGHPADSDEPGERAGAPAHHGERPRHWPWPMAVEPTWDAVHTDETWHATYWIAEWPRVDVTPDFLGPLLFSPLRRSISLIMEPISPSRAARQVAQARTADLADGELRRRGGFLVTARHTREKESVEERDVELADGHTQYRFSGYLTVTSDSREELTTSCLAAEQAAGQAGVELRLLYGAQDATFACSLPSRSGALVRNPAPRVPAHVTTTRHLSRPIRW